MQARIWNNSTWVKETDPRKIKDYYGGVLQKCGFKILDFMEYNFNPQGYTAIWLLGESHFAVHTFPEYGKSYIELSSCNPDYYNTYIEMTKNL